MLAINSFQVNFQAKPSCEKFAAKKTKNLAKFLQENLNKTEVVAKKNSPLESQVVATNLIPRNNTDMNKVVSTQAVKGYKTTSEKMAEQKGAKLFQEI